MSTIYALVKLLDKEEHVQNFVNGKLFMNTIRSFKKYKDKSGELRGDKYEGIIGLYQPKKLKEIKIGDHIIPASDLSFPIVVHSEHLLDHHVFCLYSLNSHGHKSISAETLAEFRRTLELHDSCFGLGKYCVVILNASEFISRCKSAIKKLNFKGNLGLVEYYDENKFHGNMTKGKLGYQKRSLFAQQREYRIKIDTNSSSSEPYTLYVGDLNDIATITTPEEFNKNLKIKLPDGSHT